MFRWLKRAVQSTASRLTMYRQPSHLAAGVAAGLLVGLLPKESVLPWMLATGFLFTRANYLLLAVTATICTIASPQTDWLSHEVGRWFLETPLFASSWSTVSSLPIVPWLSLTNSVTCGTLALSIPICFVGYRSSRVVFIRLFAEIENRRLSKLARETTTYRNEITKQKIRRDAGQVGLSKQSHLFTSPSHASEKPTPHSFADSAHADSFESASTAAAREATSLSEPETRSKISAAADERSMETHEPLYHPQTIELASDDDDLIELIDGKVVIDRSTGHIHRIDSADAEQFEIHMGNSTESEEAILAAIADDISAIQADAAIAQKLVESDRGVDSSFSLRPSLDKLAQLQDELAKLDDSPVPTYPTSNGTWSTGDAMNRSGNDESESEQETVKETALEIIRFTDRNHGETKENRNRPADLDPRGLNQRDGDGTKPPTRHAKESSVEASSEPPSSVISESREPVDKSPAPPLMNSTQSQPESKTRMHSSTDGINASDEGLSHRSAEASGIPPVGAPTSSPSQPGRPTSADTQSSHMSSFHTPSNHLEPTHTASSTSAQPRQPQLVTEPTESLRFLLRHLSNGERSK